MTARRCFSQWAFAALLLLGLMPAWGRAEIRWPANGAVVSDAPGNHYSTFVLADASGGAFIAYVWNPAGQTQTYIMAQHLDAQGNRTWTPSGVTVSAGNDSRWDPQIVAGPDGGIFVGWHYSSDTTYMDVYLQYLNAQGQTQWASPLLVSDTDDAQQMLFATARDPSGNLLISWFDSSYDWQGHLHAQKINSLGQKLWNGAHDVVVCTSTAMLTHHTLSPTGDGGCVITWVDERTDAAGDLYAQRLDTSGNALWVSQGVAVCAAAGAQTYPVSCPGGSSQETWVAWQDFRSGSYFNIYAQKLDASGARLGPANGLGIAPAARSQINPQICPGTSGTAYVLWADNRSVTTMDIYGQRMNANVTAAWGAGGSTLAAYAFDQTGVCVTDDEQGNCILAYQDNRSGSAFQVYAQKVDPAGTLLWGGLGVELSAYVDQTNAVYISPNRRGGAVVAWEDARTGFQEAFAQEVDPLMPRASLVSPQAAVNTGTAQFTLQGLHLGAATSARLSQSGAPDIFGAILPGNDTQISVTFNLAGQARGWRDLVLLDGPGQTSTARSFVRVLSPGGYGLSLNPVIGTTFIPSQTRALVLQAVPDLDVGETLTSLTVENLGTARQDRDLAQVGLWKTQTAFNPGTAVFLGWLTSDASGQRWQTGPGFGTPVLLEGETLAVTLEVASAPSDFSTCQFSIPAGACRLALGNTLPAAALTNKYTQNILRVAQGIFAQFTPRAPVNAVPGQSALDLLALGLNNQSRDPQTLTQLSLSVADARGAPAQAVDWLDQPRMRITHSPSAPLECSGVLQGGQIIFTFSPPVALGSGEALEMQVTAGTARQAAGAFQLQISTPAFLNAGTLVVQNDVAVQYPVSSGVVHLRAANLAGSFHNYPNPFDASQGTTRLVFYLFEACEATLEIRTLSGALVRSLARQDALLPGLQTDWAWDGRNDQGHTVASGAYWARLTVRYPDGHNENVQRKLLMVK